MSWDRDDNDIITEMLDMVTMQTFDKVACPRCLKADVTRNEDNSYSCMKCGKRFKVEGLEV